MTDKTALVHQALGDMDHADADQWDEQGKPLLAVVRQISGDDSISMSDFDDDALAYRRVHETASASVDDREDQPEGLVRDAVEPEQESAEQKESAALDAQAEVDRLTKRIEPMQRKASELKTEIDKLQKERDKHLKKVQAHNPTRHTTVAIQNYFKTQDEEAQRQQAARARMLEVMKAAGVATPAAHPSALDAAMARKTGHGKGRKAHPALFEGGKNGPDNKAGA